MSKTVNMIKGVHRKHKAFQGRGEGAEWGMEVGEEGESGLSLIHISEPTRPP